MTISRCSLLTEWESRKFFDVHGHAWAAWAFSGSLTVPPRKTSESDLLQMTRDTLGAVAEWPSSHGGISYLCVHCDTSTSASMETDDVKETKVPVRGFLQTTKSRGLRNRSKHMHVIRSKHMQVKGPTYFVQITEDATT